MKTWIKRIGIVLASIILLAIIFGLFLPTEYSLNRSILIHAKSEVIHAYVGDLTKWDLWAPWKEEDPSIVTTYGEQTSGVGASQSWVGKDGDGSLTLTMSSPTKGIEYDLFFEAGAYKCWAAMHYDMVGKDTTNVTWSMKGNMDMPIIGGYFAMMMDSMVGTMFNRGLSNLKNQIEANHDQV